MNCVYQRPGEGDGKEDAPSSELRGTMMMCKSHTTTEVKEVSRSNWKVAPPKVVKSEWLRWRRCSVFDWDLRRGWTWAQRATIVMCWAAATTGARIGRVVAAVLMRPAAMDPLAMPVDEKPIKPRAARVASTIPRPMSPMLCFCFLIRSRELVEGFSQTEHKLKCCKTEEKDVLFGVLKSGAPTRRWMPDENCIW